MSRGDVFLLMGKHVASVGGSTVAGISLVVHPSSLYFELSFVLKIMNEYTTVYRRQNEYGMRESR